MKKESTVLILFRAEEFVLPRLKYGVPLSEKRALDISREGCSLLLDMLEGLGVVATFYVSPLFEATYGGLMDRIERMGYSVVHEISTVSPPRNYALRFLPFDLYGLIFLSGRSVSFEFSVWEFCEEIHNTELKVPFYYRKNGGLAFLKVLALLVATLKERRTKFLKF